MNLVALKRLRYPRGLDGKEYNVGDPFTALSERDAKALTLVRAAKAAPQPQPQPARAKALKAETQPPAAPPVVTEQSTTAPDGLFKQDADATENLQRRTYKRRDMTAEGSSSE